MTHRPNAARLSVIAGVCLILLAVAGLVLIRQGPQAASPATGSPVAAGTESRAPGETARPSAFGPTSPLASALLGLPPLAEPRLADTAGDPPATDIVLIIDNDADTAGDLLAWQKVAAREFVADLHLSSIAILTTTSYAQPVIPSGEPDQAAIEKAIAAIEAGGTRDLRGAVAAAASILAGRLDPGRHHLIVLMAAGAGEATTPQLVAATGPGSQTSPTLARLAIGRGSHEAILFNAGDTSRYAPYQFAPAPADIPSALQALRMQAAKSELVYAGSPAWPVRDPWSSAIPVNDGLTTIRACATTVSSAVRLALIDPSGTRLDSADPAAVTSQVTGRTCIAVRNPAGGNWTILVDGDAGARAWPVEVQLEAIPPASNRSYFQAAPSGNATWPIIVRGTYAVEIKPDGSIVYGVGGPSVQCWRAAITAMGPTAGTGGGGIVGCYDTLEATIPTTLTPGSYRIEVAARYALAEYGVDPTTVAPAGQIQRQTILSAYVAGNVDSDGDGLADDLETSYGLDPHDKSDGLADVDGDGLSTAAEITVTGTDPIRKDTDRGGEADGSEVAASRDPRDDRDDVKPVSCLDVLRSANPTQRSYAPSDTFARDLALEDTLPRTILGRPTQRASVVGEAGTEGELGAIGKITAACVGRQDADVTTAFAAADGLGGWWVEALKIKGTTGAQLEQALASESGGSWDEHAPEVRSVAGKTYRVYMKDIAVYTTGDTLYVIYWYAGLSGGESSPQPTFDPYTLFDDVVRQLP